MTENVTTPDDRELLTRWEATVHGTVVMIVASYCAVPDDVQREVYADAQLAIAECGVRLTACVARLRGREVSP